MNSDDDVPDVCGYENFLAEQTVHLMPVSDHEDKSLFLECMGNQRAEFVLRDFDFDNFNVHPADLVNYSHLVPHITQHLQPPVKIRVSIKGCLKKYNAKDQGGGLFRCFKSEKVYQHNFSNLSANQNCYQLALRYSLHTLGFNWIYLAASLQDCT